MAPAIFITTLAEKLMPFGLRVLWLTTSARPKKPPNGHAFRPSGFRVGLAATAGELHPQHCGAVVAKLDVKMAVFKGDAAVRGGLMIGFRR